MKKASISIFMIALLCFAGNSSATSPMPEEIKPGATTTVCTTYIVYLTENEKGIHLEESSSNFVFEVTEPKKDVLEKVTKFMSEKLNEGNVSDFKVECKFPTVK